MLRFVADEHIHSGIVRGIRRLHPEIDIVRVQEVGLAGAVDPVILQWAADDERIVISKDKKTMIGDAHARVAAGFPMPGLFILRESRSMGEIIDELLIMAICSDPDEFKDRVEYVPL